MASFTKRIDHTIRDLGDFYDGSWSVYSYLERIGNLSGNVSGLSLRFIGVNIAQGATISSAKITFRASSSKTNTDVKFLIHGVDEDNTAEFTTAPIDDARTRTQTTASVAWAGAISWTSGSDYDTADIASIIQEIVNRGSWSSGNALAISIQDNGSGTSEYLNPKDYAFGSATAPLLTIVYEVASDSPSPSPSSSPSASFSSSESSSASPSGSLSPSASESVSVSPSLSPSSSLSPSASESSSVSPSESASPSPSPLSPFFGLRILKPASALAGKSVLTTDDPQDLIFSSRYGTLKYFITGTFNFTIDGDLDGNLESVGQAAYTHDLGYYPYVEVYVLKAGGKYEYCPTYNGGAGTTWQTFVNVTTTQLKVYAHISGFSQGGVEFTFKYFIYKNDLKLS